MVGDDDLFSAAFLQPGIRHLIFIRAEPSNGRKELIPCHARNPRRRIDRVAVCNRCTWSRQRGLVVDIKKPTGALAAGPSFERVRECIAQPKFLHYPACVPAGVLPACIPLQYNATSLPSILHCGESFCPIALYSPLRALSANSCNCTWRSSVFVSALAWRVKDEQSVRLCLFTRARDSRFSPSLDGSSTAIAPDHDAGKCQQCPYTTLDDLSEQFLRNLPAVVVGHLARRDDERTSIGRSSDTCNLQHPLQPATMGTGERSSELIPQPNVEIVGNGAIQPNVTSHHPGSTPGWPGWYVNSSQNQRITVIDHRLYDGRTCGFPTSSLFSTQRH